MRAANQAGNPLQLQAHHVGHGLVLAHVDEHPARPIAEVPQASVAQGAGDVVGHQTTLADRVLGRRGTRFAVSLRGIRDRGRVADGPNVLPAGHPQRPVHHDPPVLVELEPERVDVGGGLHPGRPARHTGGDPLAGRQHREVLAQLVEPSARADLDSPAAQLAGGEIGQARRDLRHHPVEGLDKDPARAVEAAARITLDDRCHEVLQLGDALQPRVARTDEHEGEVLLAAAAVTERLGDLQLEQSPVTERDGVGNRLEAEAVLGEPGHREHPGDRAHRDDQLVVAQDLGSPVGRRVAQLRERRVGTGYRPEPDVGALQLLAQRDHHVARLERAGRGPRQQWRVEQEVLRAHERDLRRMPGQDALEAAGGVEAAEPSAGYDDVPGHPFLSIKRGLRGRP